MMEFTEIGCDTVKSYHKGEDWVAEFAEGLGSFSAGTLAGDGAMFAVAFLELPLLAVVLIGGVVTVTVTEQTKEILEQFFERYPK